MAAKGGHIDSCFLAPLPSRWIRCWYLWYQVLSGGVNISRWVSTNSLCYWQLVVTTTCMSASRQYISFWIAFLFKNLIVLFVICIGKAVSCRSLGYLSRSLVYLSFFRNTQSWQCCYLLHCLCMDFSKHGTSSEDWSWDPKTLAHLVLHTHAFLTELTWCKYGRTM